MAKQDHKNNQAARELIFHEIKENDAAYLKIMEAQRAAFAEMFPNPNDMPLARATQASRLGNSPVNFEKEWEKLEASRQRTQRTLENYLEEKFIDKNDKPIAPKDALQKAKDDHQKAREAVATYVGREEGVEWAINRLNDRVGYIKAFEYNHRAKITEKNRALYEVGGSVLGVVSKRMRAGANAIHEYSIRSGRNIDVESKLWEDLHDARKRESEAITEYATVNVLQRQIPSQESIHHSFCEVLARGIIGKPVLDSFFADVPEEAAGPMKARAFQMQALTAIKMNLERSKDPALEILKSARKQVADMSTSRAPTDGDALSIYNIFTLANSASDDQGKAVSLEEIDKSFSAAAKFVPGGGGDFTGAGAQSSWKADDDTGRSGAGSGSGYVRDTGGSVAVFSAVSSDDNSGGGDAGGGGDISASINDDPMFRGLKRFDLS